MKQKHCVKLSRLNYCLFGSFVVIFKTTSCPGKCICLFCFLLYLFTSQSCPVQHHFSDCMVSGLHAEWLASSGVKPGSKSMLVTQSLWLVSSGLHTKGRKYLCQSLRFVKPHWWKYSCINFIHTDTQHFYSYENVLHVQVISLRKNLFTLAENISTAARLCYTFKNLNLWNFFHNSHFHILACTLFYTYEMVISNYRLWNYLWTSFYKLKILKTFNWLRTHLH